MTDSHCWRKIWLWFSVVRLDRMLLLLLLLFDLSHNARPIQRTTGQPACRGGSGPCQRDGPGGEDETVCSHVQGEGNTQPELVCRSGLCSALFLFGLLSDGITAALCGFFCQALTTVSRMMRRPEGSEEEAHHLGWRQTPPEKTGISCTGFMFHSENSSGYLL